MDSPTPDHVIMFMDDYQTRKVHSLDDPPHRNSPLSDTRSPSAAARALRPLPFSKPKARFAEFLPPPNQNFIVSEQHDPFLNYEATDVDETEDELDDEYNEEGFRKGKPRKHKFKIKPTFLIEWSIFITLSAGLVCSLTIPMLKSQVAAGFELWRWFLMMLVIFSGHLVSSWIVRIAVFFIQRNYTLREKVLYFVYGLRKRIQNCVWTSLVLLSWTFIFKGKLHKKHKLVDKAFQALAAFLIGATIWLVKIVLVKMLASSFHVATYFDRMKESVFHHYVLDTLSGPPMDEGAYEEAHQRRNSGPASTPMTPRAPRNMRDTNRVLSRSGKAGATRRIDIEKLKKLSMQSKASAWTIKKLVKYVRTFGLTTISKTAVEEMEITSEWEAKDCAKRIFKNVAKPGAKYIEDEDLMRFLNRVEIHTIIPLFEGALETGNITKSSFRNWVVRAYYERKSLAHSLNDTKTAVQQLHKLASGVVSVVIIVVTLTVMGVASTKVIAFMLTQLLLLGFTFQNMCKTVFESIVFVFVMHPFDTGDRCVIDGVQLVVEEMNILTTVFLRYDNEKIYYPNSVLITKPISNFYRSPEMCDGIDFTIDSSTPTETITAFKKAIQTYIESKPKYWNPKHSVIVKNIENLDKLKMALCVQHTINHQNYGDRCIRITELILELKKMFENFSIKYNLLPQEVHLTQVNNMGNWRVPLPS